MRTLNTLLAAVTVAALTACGGGGGGETASPGSPTSPAPSTPSTPTSPSTPANVVANEGTLQTAAGPSAYAPDSFEADIYATLNSVRHMAGAGYMSQSAQLDVAATAHAKYLETNQTGGHEQDPSKPDFYEVSHYSRIAKAGFDAGYATEVIGGLSRNAKGSNCVFGLMNTVYHAKSLLSPTTNVGVGISLDGAGIPGCVVKLAAKSTERNVQVAPAGSLVAYPYDGQKDVYETFFVGYELPRPPATLFPNMTAGTPVIVSMRNADFLNFEAAGTLSPVVTKFDIKDAQGNLIPAAILANPGITGSGVKLNADSLLSAGFAVLVPFSPLSPGVTYTVTFTATLKTGGAPLTKTWSFTTDPNALPEPPLLPIQ